jgi:hypothetical protein
LKDVIAVHIFEDGGKLFGALKKAWNEIPNLTVENLCTSFKARLKSCLERSGECLNGRWQRVCEIYHAQGSDGSLNAISDIAGRREGRSYR